MLEIITLYRGNENAVVEVGSQAEADMKALGFSGKAPAAMKAEAKAESVSVAKDKSKS
jgi:hypothetical protein